MNRMKRSLLAVALAGTVALTPAVYMADPSAVMTVYAHGHHSGSHHSSSGTNYYYCNGHDAHTHHNGVCPYANASLSVRTIRQVQKKLKQCGYNCGTADGVIGSKTIKAVKKFQRDNGLTVDGIIGEQTLRALGL